MKPVNDKPTRGVPETAPNLPALPKAKRQRAPMLTQATASRIKAKAASILGVKR